MLGRTRHAAQYRAVVRFSLFDPDWKGWRSTNSGAFASADEYRQWLWAPGRMEPRFRIFGHYAAPIYQQISERHDFRVLVQHSHDLPETWLERLRGLADEHPALRLVPLPGWEEARDTVERDMLADGRTGVVAMLRVDDDDLIASDFVDQLSTYARPQFHGWAVSLGMGLAGRYQDGRITDLREFPHPLSSIGQAYVGRFDRRRRHLDLSPLRHHRKVSQTLPTVLDSREVAFVQVRHDLQDTRLGASTAQTEARLRAELGRLKKVAATPELREKFPTLEDQLTSS